jgi:hypothetical protein
MKRYGLPLALVALAVLVTWLILNPPGRGGLSDEESEYQFGFRDTAAIDSFSVSDKSPQSAVLKRGKNGWTVDGKPARADAVEVMLETLARMEMRNFLAPNAQNEAIKRMAVYGKEVSVWSKGKRVLHFFVGTDTPDQSGTYMMNASASQVFAVHMPGFNGFLSTRFIPDPVLWRDRLIFGAFGEKLRSLRMEYPREPIKSFQLERDQARWRLAGSADEVDQARVETLLATLRTLRFEGAIVEKDPIFARKDSLLASSPVWLLELEDASGRVQSVRGYAIKPPEDTYDSQGNPLTADPDRLHGILSDGQMVLLQYFGLQRVMISAADLKIKTSSESAQP